MTEVQEAGSVTDQHSLALICPSDIGAITEKKDGFSTIQDTVTAVPLLIPSSVLPTVDLSVISLPTSSHHDLFDKKSPQHCSTSNYSLFLSRYNVGTAWLFVAMSWATAAMHITHFHLLNSPHPTSQLSHRVALFIEVEHLLNGVFMTVYAVAYFGFLVTFFLQTSYDIRTFIGLATFIIGYTCFGILGLLSYLLTDEVSKWLYVAGAVLFLIGSAAYVSITAKQIRSRSPPTEIYLVDSSHSEERRKQSTAHYRKLSLFIGSAMFVLGSLFFTKDSLHFILSSNAHARFIDVLAGNITFLLGRFFFLYGLADERCGVFGSMQQQKHQRLDSRQGSGTKGDQDKNLSQICVE